METLKSEKFDVAIGESMDVCFYGIVRRAGIPKYISAFSTNLYVGAASILGLPALPSFIPGFIEVQPNMTYWDRARNLMTNVLLYYTGKQIFVDPIEKVVKAHLGEDFDTEVSSKDGQRLPAASPSTLLGLGKLRLRFAVFFGFGSGQNYRRNRSFSMVFTEITAGDTYQRKSSRIWHFW